MNKIIDLEKCFLVHTRKYTDSKNIVTLLTQDHGLVSGVLRVGKRKKIPVNLPPFCLVHASWMGKLELKTITFWESTSTVFNLSGPSLFCAMYINEIIVRLVHEGEHSRELFALYFLALEQLSHSDDSRFEQEKALREFELAMLAELGFAINLYGDVENKTIDSNTPCYYTYDPQAGFNKISIDKLGHEGIDTLIGQSEYSQSGVSTFSGTDLFNIAQSNWNSKSLKSAKRLTRLALAPLLGGKPIKARELFS